MRILVYKRTHNGDPDASGCFGAFDCMGPVRAWNFDAVIGIGGNGREAQANEIAGKINWIGKGPHKTATKKRGPNVRFEHFRDFGTEGPLLAEIAPTLAKRFLSPYVRHVMDDMSKTELAEAIDILKLVQNAAVPSGKQRRIVHDEKPKCPVTLK